MELRHEQNRPGAETFDDSWTTEVIFNSDEIVIEYRFIERLKVSPLQVYPEDVSKYVLAGRFTNNEVVDFILGRAVGVDRPHKTKARPTMAVDVSPKYL
jgi:hypothetical protein